MLLSGAGTVPPLFLLGGGLFDAPFRLFEQRESFSCSSFFLITARSELFVSPLVRISYSPSLLFGAKNELFMSPLPFGGGDIWCFVLPPLFGEGRSVFRGRRKGVGVLGKTRDLLRTETNLKKSRRLLPPRARMSGRRGTSLREGGSGVLTRPSDQMHSEARRSLPRSKILASFSSVSSMTGSSAFVFLEASLL